MLARILLLFVCALLFNPAGQAFALAAAADQSTDAVEVKGLVRSVSPQEQTLTLRQDKGQKITIMVEPTTVFEGFTRLDDLEPKQRIRVRYLPGASGNTAITIERPLDLGC